MGRRFGQFLLGMLAASGLLGSVDVSAQAKPRLTLERDSEVIFAVNEGVTYRVTPHETRERYAELAAEISRTLRRKVRIEPVENYKTLRAGLEEKRYDIAYVHPAHHALRAVRDQGYQVIAVTRGFADYRARFLVPKDAKIANAEQLRGAAMVMPDPDSITAWLARAALRDLGMDPAKEKLASTRYQDGIPFMMEKGFYQVGITASNSVIKQWTERDGRVVHQSRPIAIKQVLASPDLLASEVLRLRALFLEMERNDRGKAILATLGFAGFQPADEASLAQATKWLGL